MSNDAPPEREPTTADARPARSTAELAHDLANALCVVQASLETLDRLLGRLALTDGVLSRAHGSVQAALHGADLARVLTQELRGDRTTARESLSLESVLEAAIAIARGSGSWRGASVVSLADREICVCADRSDLVNVFANLLTNAVESSDPSRDNFIVIRTRSCARDVEVLVSDTGCGMSPEVRARVLSGAYSTKEGAGRGLGLRIVTRLLAHSGGAMAIDSELGAGTVVHVTLPRARPEGELR
jgi:signal transduction histidine kinase